jgi:glutamate dehydrogenase/leucine dehydrogenase
VRDIPATADAFYKELAELRAKFEAMQPELEVTVRDPAMGVEGYVVVWNTAICKGGPLEFMGKGGTRVIKDLKFDDIKRLARTMAKKNAAAGLAFGGSKSGLKLDPSDPDYEKKYRRFVDLCKPFLHENGGIFGGFGWDVGCKPPLNAIWACDQAKSLRAHTGKPVDMGGTDYDIEGIAGLGVAVAAKVLIEENGGVVQGKTFSVQGMGAMGAAVTKYFSEAGGALKFLSDPKYGGTWEITGSGSPALIDALFRQKKDDVTALLAKEGKKISEDSADALYADADVLFPCAMEDQIRADNVGRVRARFLAEGANNPTTAEAYRALFEKGVRIVPAIIANPGGIISAFVELASKVTPEENVRTRAKVKEAKETTNTRVTANVKRLVALVNTLGVPPDEAADYMAYCNIFYGLGK